MTSEAAQWIAVDWGTSNLRLWVMSAAGRVMKALSSDKGMASLSPEAFEPELLRLIEPYLTDAPMPVICCGMVGAKQGWREAAYAAVPCPPPSAEIATRVETHDPRIRVAIVPGLMQMEPGDVMRGEETQVAGFLAQNPGFEGTLCLPGTHSKWVQIRAGTILQFKTFMTGELFALIASHSILRHSLSEEDWSQAAFDQAVDDALGRPELFASHLFGLRADSLLKDLAAGRARARLSGLLIGLELAGAKPYWSGQALGLIGAPQLCERYKSALDRAAVPSTIYVAEHLTLDGLKSAYHALNGAQE